MWVGGAENGRTGQCCEVEGTGARVAGGREEVEEGGCTGSGAEEIEVEEEGGVAGVEVTGSSPLPLCDLVRGKPEKWLAAVVQAGQELRVG